MTMLIRYAETEMRFWWFFYEVRWFWLSSYYRLSTKRTELQNRNSIRTFFQSLLEGAVRKSECNVLLVSVRVRYIFIRHKINNFIYETKMIIFIFVNNQNFFFHFFLWKIPPTYSKSQDLSGFSKLLEHPASFYLAVKTVKLICTERLLLPPDRALR